MVTSATGSVTGRGTGRKCIAAHIDDNPLMPRARRLRGLLLRLVLNRPLAVAIGAALVLPGAWVLFADYSWESGATDGLALVSLATGAAIAWTGVTGRQADWIE